VFGSLARERVTFCVVRIMAPSELSSANFSCWFAEDCKITLFYNANQQEKFAEFSAINKTLKMDVSRL
jgi:hypothetical protein